MKHHGHANSYLCCVITLPRALPTSLRLLRVRRKVNLPGQPSLTGNCWDHWQIPARRISGASCRRLMVLHVHKNHLLPKGRKKTNKTEDQGIHILTLYTLQSLLGLHTSQIKAITVSFCVFWAAVTFFSGIKEAYTQWFCCCIDMSIYICTISKDQVCSSGYLINSVSLKCQTT